MKKRVLFFFTAFLCLPELVFAGAGYREFIKERWYTNANYIEFSKNGNSFFTATINKKWAVSVFNYEESRVFDAIKYAYFWPQTWAYGVIAKRDKKELVYVDGKESELYDSIENIYFSKNEKHFAFIAHDREAYLLFVDWELVDKFESISNFSFMDEEWGKYLYIANNGEWDSMYINRESIARNEHMSQAKVSPTWEYAYVGKEDGLWKVFSSIGDSETYDNIGDLVISLDGKGYAFNAKREGKWIVVINREEYREYESSYLLQYWPNADSFVYVWERWKKHFLVKNREERETFDIVKKIQYIKDSGTFICTGKVV